MRSLTGHQRGQTSEIFVRSFGKPRDQRRRHRRGRRPRAPGSCGLTHGRLARGGTSCRSRTGGGHQILGAGTGTGGIGFVGISKSLQLKRENQHMLRDIAKRDRLALPCRKPRMSTEVVTELARTRPSTAGPRSTIGKYRSRRTTAGHARSREPTLNGRPFRPSAGTVIMVGEADPPLRSNKMQ